MNNVHIGRPIPIHPSPGSYCNFLLHATDLLIIAATVFSLRNLSLFAFSVTSGSTPQIFKLLLWWRKKQKSLSQCSLELCLKRSNETMTSKRYCWDSIWECFLCAYKCSIIRAIDKNVCLLLCFSIMYKFWILKASY